MSFTLYVRADCHDCHRVTEWMTAHEVPYELDDIDHARAPFEHRLFIAPALCRNGTLCAYGMDIIPYLERHHSIGQASPRTRITSS